MAIDTELQAGMSGPAPGLMSPRFRAFTIGSIALISLAAFESMAVTTAMPAVAQHLNGLALYALAFAAPLAAGIIGMVVGGSWSDARGPARPLWAGVALFALGLLIAGSAARMEFVVAGRIVQGFGSGLDGVALYVAVARILPASLHPRMFAGFAAAWVVPAIVGPAAAGLVVQYIGWRWVFLAVPVLAVPAALMVRPALRAVPADRREWTLGSGRRIAWAVGVAASAATLHIAGQQRGPLAVALLVVALIALLVSAPRLMPRGFLTVRRGLPTVMTMRGLAGSAFFGAEVFVPLLLYRERGLSPAGAGLALTVGAVTWSLGSAYQGRANQPLSKVQLVRLGMTLMAGGIGVLALTVAPATPVVVGILGWGIAGLGIGMVFPTLSVLTLQLSAPDEQGHNTSTLGLSDSMFTVTVLALGGALLAATPDPGPAVYLAGFATAALLALLGATAAPRLTATPDSR